MSGEASCDCGRDLSLMCRACDIEVCDECLQLPKARRHIQLLENALRCIASGKIQADNEHPLGEHFAMTARFIDIAKAALKKAPTR